jgi:hypothetical protein
VLLGPWGAPHPASCPLPETVAVDSMCQGPQPGSLSALKDTGAVKGDDARVENGHAVATPGRYDVAPAPPPYTVTTARCGDGGRVPHAQMSRNVTPDRALPVPQRDLRWRNCYR